MKLVKPLNLSLLHKVYEHDKGFFLSVGVLVLFPFVPRQGRGLDLGNEPDLWNTAGQALGKDAMLDMAMPKPMAEVLVAGKCFAPGPEPKTPIQGRRISLTFGEISKTLAVFGDRYWKKAAGLVHVITDPEPFTEMELGYDKAFGGPGYEANPTGKGAAPVLSPDGREIMPLPNLEYPGKLIADPGDRPAPAALNTIGLDWPPRMKLAGTYDRDWQENYFPGLAQDIQWTYFNSAAKDQRRGGWFTGDEAFCCQGMHPEKDTVQGRLPGIRVRCFTQRKQGNDTPLLEEIGTHVDTVWLFPHLEQGVAIHRGVARIADDEAEDVTHMLLAYERLTDEPRSQEHYHQALAKRADPDSAAKYALEERDLIPEGEKSAYALIIEQDQENRPESPLKANMERKAELQREKAKEMVLAMGLDPEKVFAKPDIQEELGLDDLVNIDAIEEKIISQAREIQEKKKEHFRQLLEEQGLDFETFRKQAEKAGTPRPSFSADKAIAQLREMVGENPELEEKIRRTEEQVRQAYQRFAHRFDGPEKPPADRLDMIRERIQAGLAQGFKFTGSDLCHADLSNLDLSGADLSDTLMEHVNLTGTLLTGANLAGAVLTRADLSRAKLDDADLTRANLGLAKLQGAKLSRAKMREAVLFQAELTGADLTGADLAEADFTEAKAAGVDLSEAVLTKVIFMNTSLANANLCRANLGQALFFSCDLHEADLSDVKAPNVLLVEAKAQKAVLTRATMNNATIVKECDFTGANFQGATLTQSGLRGCCFQGADFSHALLDMADLSECDLSRAKLVRARARQARFEKSDLTEADFSMADLMEGSLRKARLTSACFSRASLFGAEFFRAVLGGTDFTGADLNRTKLVNWQPS